MKKIVSLIEVTKPIAILVSGLVLVMLVTASLGVWQHNQNLSHAEAAPKTTAPAAKKTTPVATVKAEEANPTTPDSLSESAIQNVSVSKPVQEQNSPTTPSTIETPITPGTTPADSSPVVTPVTPSPKEETTVIATLNINGQTKGNVTLGAGSSQCDLLNQALSTGLISSLEMQFNSQLGSYGIFVIDGIGSTGEVWWVYTVNGKSPPGGGCSKVLVKGGDIVNWQYLKR